MDTPWLYFYMAHKLSQLQHGTTQFTSEITTRKLVTIRNLVLDGLYRERGRDREGHLYLFTPTVTHLKVIMGIFMMDSNILHFIAYREC